MPRPESNQDTCPTRVLVAEDHEASRHLLQRNLAYWGYEVVAVPDGEAAVEILIGNNPPPLALIDRMMPGLSGLDVCREARKRMDGPYLYLILVTALGAKNDITAGLEAGADDYVVKPFEPDELKARLKVGHRIVGLERRHSLQVQALEHAVAEVRQLKKLLPICMYCKRIRDDRHYWRQIEEYIHAEVGTDFSHGICPDCMEKIGAELDPRK